VIAAAILAAAIAPAAAQAAETGVGTDLSAPEITRKTQDRTANALRDVNAEWVRLIMNWSDSVEPADGVYSFTTLNTFDRAVELAREAGYKILVTVQKSPTWANGGADDSSPPADSAELAEYMGFLAGRYAGQVQAYEVWAEPNNLASWPLGPNPVEYAWMLRTVSPSIRAADPDAEIVFGGLYGNDYDYLERMYAALPDIGDYFDVMATHAYVDSAGSPETAWLDGAGRLGAGVFSAYREVRATMEAHGDPKPIWLTQFGWSTTTQSGLGVSAETQADYLTRAYECLEQDPYVDVALWFSLRNQSGDDTWRGQLGMMSRNFTPKPAYDALRNYEPGAGGCKYERDPAPAAGPEPEPVDDPDPRDDGDRPGDDSSVRSSPVLDIKRARLRRGRLTISGSVARGVTGKIRGRAHFGRGLRRFTLPIDGRGRFQIDTKLRGARRASSARVSLSYRGTRRYLSQTVTIKVGRKSTQLRVLKVS
jgi:hypothetical protein